MTKNIKRKRLDELLVEAGLANDIVVAGSLILAGRVEVLGLDTSVVLNSGETFPLGTKIKLKTSPKYVARAGVKLEFALEQFEIDTDYIFNDYAFIDESETSITFEKHPIYAKYFTSASTVVQRIMEYPLNLGGRRYEGVEMV